MWPTPPARGLPRTLCANVKDEDGGKEARTKGQGPGPRDAIELDLNHDDVDKGARTRTRTRTVIKKVRTTTITKMRKY